MRRVITIAALRARVSARAHAAGRRRQEFGTSDAQAIRQATPTLEAAFNAKDVDKILDAVHGQLRIHAAEQAAAARARTAQELLRRPASGGSKDLKLTPDDVAGHGPLAYESGSYSMMNGNNPDRGKFLFVFRNMGGSWKIEYTSWSSDLPPSSVSTD